VWPSGILDLLFSCLLMVVFLQLKRQATALASSRAISADLG